MGWQDDLDRWLTTPPEPSVAKECANCQADLYVGCDYVRARDTGEWYCDDNCLIEHMREKGYIATEEISEEI